MSKNISFGVLAIAGLLPLSSCGQTSSKKGSAITNMNITSVFIATDTTIDFAKLKAIIPDSVYQKIYSEFRTIVIDKLGVDSSEVVPTASFTNDLGADSLDTVELIMEVEKFYGISIPDEIAEKVTIVDEAVLVIYKISRKLND